MKTSLPLLVLLLAFSCSRPGDDTPPPEQNENNTDSTPAPHYNFGKLISINDTLSVYDATTGKLLINTTCCVLSSAAVSNTTVSDSLAWQPTPSSLRAMNINTGKTQYNKYFSNNYGYVSTCFPVIDSPYIYQGAYNTKGEFKLFCMLKNTGETIWESNAALSRLSDDISNPYIPSLVQTDTTILANMVDGPACFSKATGKLIWQNNSNTEFTKLNLYPSVQEGKLFVTSAHTVYAFDAVNGQFLWKTTLPGTGLVQKAPVYAWQNTAYAYTVAANSSMNMTLYAMNINTGEITNSLSYPLAQWYIQFYEGYFYTYENINKTWYPQRISKRLLGNGNAVWSNDLEGGTYLGVVITPGFVYCSEADVINSSPAWQRMKILDQNTGKILKTFPLRRTLSFAAVVKDSTGKTWQPARWWVR